jgi:hypothetical protein
LSEGPSSGVTMDNRQFKNWEICPLRVAFWIHLEGWTNWICVPCIEYITTSFQTSVEWKDVTLKVESMLNPFSPYSCNENTPVTNQSFVLTTTASLFSTAMNFGDSCLVKGPYKITLELPLLANSRSGAVLSSTEALIDSVSMFQHGISSGL